MMTNVSPRSMEGPMVWEEGERRGGWREGDERKERGG